jgi:tellurite resistance protein TerC
MAFGGEKEFDPKTHPVFKRVMKVLPLAHFDGDKFFTRIGGVLHATPLFLAIVVVEVSDLVFALDSIPAIFAITTDRFLVYTSNVFAILGLRALYFLLAGLVGMFAYLKYGVAVILGYVGVKMMVSGFFHIPTLASLGVILFFLTASVVASLVLKPKE